MKVPWVSVALLIVLGLLGWFTQVSWGDKAADSAPLQAPMFVVGWIGVAGSLLVGALGLWARAPATLATALGIIGAGGFTVAWLTRLAQDGGVLLHAVMALCFVSVLVGFAASARRPSA